MKNFLIIQQLDSFLTKLSDLFGIREIPARGWVHSIRTALGMTGTQLADRLGVSQSRVARIEQDELSGAVTLRTLKQAANALECDLVYALVPRDSLKTIIEQRAEKVANAQLQRVSRNMALEDQMPTQSQIDAMKEQLIQELLSENPKHLWEE